MMREILFRGKRIDNGEWVEGYYGTNPEWDRKTYGERHWINSCKNALLYDVDPDTVGQYTGLTDKSGEKIFEGDVLQRSYMCGKKVMMGAIIAEYWNCSCCDGVFGFGIDGDVDLRDHEDCEIIGNIHDNPELVEGGEGNA